MARRRSPISRTGLFWTGNRGIVIQRGLALDRLGWSGLAGLIVGTGAPYALVVAFGLRFAPAYDGGVLNPGCMPFFVALIASLPRREAFNDTKTRSVTHYSAGVSRFSVPACRV